MSSELKKVPARFYRSATGREPVREWLKALDPDDRRVIGQDIVTVKYGMKKKHKAIGSSFNGFLKKEGDYDAAQALAVKRVLAWQIQKAMKEMHLAKAEMARRMKTSRSHLERLLDPYNDSLTLTTLARAGHVLGREIRLELV